MDENHWVRLSEPVHPTVPLGELRGREGDLKVDDPVAVVLEIDSLARRVSREEDPDRVAIGVRLEDALDALPCTFIHTAEDPVHTLTGNAGSKEMGVHP